MRRLADDEDENDFGGHRAWFIGLDQFIQNKEAAGRDQDLADARLLRKRTGAD